MIKVDSANMPHVKVPSRGTLRRYGLTEGEWRKLLDSQGGVCAICQSVPPSGILCVDHEHVRGWRKMKPTERRRFVRGLACPHCNHRLLGRFITLARLGAVVAYLEAYSKKAAAQQTVE